jgi:hypothetical protein
VLGGVFCNVLNVFLLISVHASSGDLNAATFFLLAIALLVLCTVESTVSHCTAPWGELKGRIGDLRGLAAQEADAFGGAEAYPRQIEK